MGARRSLIVSESTHFRSVDALRQIVLVARFRAASSSSEMGCSTRSEKAQRSESRHAPRTRNSSPHYSLIIEPYEDNTLVYQRSEWRWKLYQGFRDLPSRAASAHVPQDLDSHHKPMNTTQDWSQRKQLLTVALSRLGAASRPIDVSSAHQQCMEMIESVRTSEFERGRLQGIEEERARCKQIAHYWSIEITAEISAQADISHTDVPMFRRGCTFVAEEISKGSLAPYELDKLKEE